MPGLNAKGSTLAGVDCTLCHNTGQILRRDESGVLYVRECECMNRRRSLRNIRKSGLEKLMQIYTFDTFTADTEWTKGAKRVSMEYIRSGQNKWFYICGIPGSGKTHLCTAICAELIRKNVYVRYVLWRDLSQELKAHVNDDEYAKKLRELSEVPVLYIDDFLKGTVTDADMNRAIELITARYNNWGTRTIISSERSIRDIRDIDEATGSRIYQRAKEYILKTPSRNWREE